MSGLYYAGEAVTFEMKNLRDGVLVNADSVAFKTKLNDEDAVTASAAAITNPETGIYKTNVTAAKHGMLIGSWAVTNSGLVNKEEKTVKIFEAV